MRLDPTIATSQQPEALRAAEAACLPGERLLGLFTATRLVRMTSYLLVTDQRILTLGLLHKGYPVLDEIDLFAVESVRIERDKILRYGDVVVTSVNGQVEGYGALNSGKKYIAFDLMEEVVQEALERHRSNPAPLLPAPGGTGGREVLPGKDPVDGEGDADLVSQLTELARLHEADLLTDDEFAAAKARVLDA